MVLNRNIFECSLTHYMDDNMLEILQNVKVGVAGVGGLGSNILHAIVRTGICKLIICDFDRVEAHNLNRQNYISSDIGLYKVDATKSFLKKINEDIEIETYTTKITDENIINIFNDCDVVFEAFDEPIYKKMMFEKLSDSDKILLFGNGLAGISIMDNSPFEIREIKKDIFIVGDNISEVNIKTPPFAPKVMAVASLMAAVGIEAILRKYK